MDEPSGLPPGRAGRTWVRHRLETADRAASLLDRKLQVLRSERERLREQDDRAEREWIEAFAEAQRWLVRSALLGGEREVRMAAATEPGAVELSWSAVMGVRYPAVEGFTAPDPVEAPRPPGTSAMPVTVAAYTKALEAASRRAATSAALSIVSAEVTATARRLRAINHRWIPRLEAARDAVDRRLDEAERDENARLRWAAARGAGSIRFETGS
jgi:V/A-type H+/Na+-transporting ATPase subunit D